jgi:hypothetical protein
VTVDISRQSFTARKSYSGVLMAQGRVQLDADWNEWDAILDRRRRVAMGDLVGEAAVSPLTTDAFRVEVSGGALTIGIGRLYLDGRLAENFGAGAPVFDADVENLVGTAPTPFTDQPWRPGVAAPTPTAGRHMVYLDVWRRVVGHLQDPGLVEPALGVDTTARTQTVWQVRTLAVDGGVTCATPDADIAGWPGLIRSSAARLTTRNVTAPDPQDPCLLPPGAAYRGLENRTYRVEIHDQAPDGRWRFKWSHDNATVASAVTAVETLDRLRVTQVARDDVKRFSPGDWVEVLDDRLELEAIPAPLRRILSVDDGTGLIGLETGLPAGLFVVDGDGVPEPSRHLRLRKWNQTGELRASDGELLADLTDAAGPGVVRVPAAGETVGIEPGIELAFTLAEPAGDMRIGDHWIFTARTATGRIEELEAAPPAGHHHHYLRLAVVEADGEAFVGPASDCRPNWPLGGDAACCCTEVVAPGEDIQAAIDRVPAAGGCVCLRPGEHRIATSLRVARDNLALKGESPGTVIRGPGAGPLLVVAPTGELDRVEAIRVEGIAFLGDGGIDDDRLDPAVDLDGLVVLDRVRDVAVDDCRLGAVAAVPLAGLRVRDALELDVRHCRFTRVQVAIWTEDGGHALAFTDNHVDGGALAAAGAAAVGIFAGDVDGRLVVARNGLVDVGFGIVVVDDPTAATPSSRAHGALIADNHLTLAPRGDAATDLPATAIDVAADAALVAGNRVVLGGPGQRGIRVVGSGTRVGENRIQSDGPTVDASGPYGIQIGAALEESEAVTREVAVLANLLTGAMHAIVVADAAAVEIAHNTVRGAAADENAEPSAAIALDRAHRTRVTDNTVEGTGFAVLGFDGAYNRIVANALEGPLAGVTLARETGPEVAANRVRDTAQWGILGFLVAGAFTVRDNRLTGCGHAGSPAFALGAWLVLGEWHVAGNEIVDTGLAVDDGDDPPLAYGITGDLVQEASLRGNRVGYADPSRRDAAAEDRALRLRGLIEARYTFGEGEVAFGFEALVTGNRFVGRGRSALVEFREQALTDTVNLRFESITFNDNVCRHVIAPDAADEDATVRFASSVAIAMGNRVKASRRTLFAFDFAGAAGTYVGNVTTGGVTGFSDFPNPSTDYNRQL